MSAGEELVVQKLTDGENIRRARLHPLALCPTIFPSREAMDEYESLQKDADHVCDALGLPRKPLPRLNASQHRRYRDCYDRETRRLVASLYRADIELFDYEF